MTRSPGEDVDEYGAVVVDVEDHDADRAVVINTPPATAEDWGVYYNDDGEEVTVADMNPDYDPEEEVIVVAFEEDLDRPDYDGEEPLALAELECGSYAFPPNRLRRVDHVSNKPGDTPQNRTDAEKENKPSDYPQLSSLAEALTGDASVVVDGEEAPYVEIEKLGETHLIFPDGTVRGNVMGAKLAKFASEHLEGEQ